MNQTFAMLKPDCLSRGLVEPIETMIESHGFIIQKQKEVIVDQELILKHYQEVIQRFDSPQFTDNILKAFVGKTVIAMIVASDSDDCVDDFRTLVGKTDPSVADKDSIRGKYGNDSLEIAKNQHRMLNNLIHASDSQANAQLEIDLWFKGDDQIAASLKPIRHIITSELTNLRDLGGYPTKDGKSTKWHTFYRSEAPYNFTAKDVEVIKSLGIKTIIDLRSDEEQKAFPYKIDGVDYHFIPLIKEYDQSLSSGIMEFKSLLQSMTMSYSKMLDQGQNILEEIYDLIAKGLDQGAIMFHCSVGKDRTGVLAAILLSIAGCKDCDIIADYEVSHTYIKDSPIIKALHAPYLMLKSNPKSMMEFLQHMEETAYIKNIITKDTTKDNIAKILKYFVE